MITEDGQETEGKKNIQAPYQDITVQTYRGLMHHAIGFLSISRGNIRHEVDDQERLGS